MLDPNEDDSRQAATVATMVNARWESLFGAVCLNQVVGHKNRDTCLCIDRAFGHVAADAQLLRIDRTCLGLPGRRGCVAGQADLLVIVTIRGDIAMGIMASNAGKTVATLLETATQLQSIVLKSRRQFRVLPIECHDIYGTVAARADGIDLRRPPLAHVLHPGGSVFAGFLCDNVFFARPMAGFAPDAQETGGGFAGTGCSFDGMAKNAATGQTHLVRPAQVEIGQFPLTRRHTEGVQRRRIRHPEFGQAFFAEFADIGHDVFAPERKPQWRANRGIITPLKPKCPRRLPDCVDAIGNGAGWGRLAPETARIRRVYGVCMAGPTMEIELTLMAFRTGGVADKLV